MNMFALYIAGPDVFMPLAKALSIIRNKYLADLGLLGLFPLDNDVTPQGKTKAQVAFEIYLKNLAMMNKCDGAIVNLSPFRAAGADPGTCFEVGYLQALGKPVFLWTTDPREYATRLRELQKYDELPKRDDYPIVEEFGQFENLMLACSSNLPVAKTFEEAALRAAMYFQQVAVIQDNKAVA